LDIQRTGVEQRSRGRKIKYGAFAVLVAAFGVITMSVSASAPSIARSSVWIDTVKRGNMLIEVGGPGTLVPQDVRWVASETAARVERLLVKPGSAVTSDSVVIELSRPDLVDQAMAAMADLKATQAEAAVRRMAGEGQLLDQRAAIETALSAAKVTQMQEKAERELMASHIFPELQVKRTALSNELAQMKVNIERERLAKMQQSFAAQVDADQARITQKRHTAELRQHQVDALRVRAGFDGVLQQVLVEAGQQVAEGAPLARVAKTDNLMAQLRIPETQASQLRPGQQVRVDTRNGTVIGAVARIDPKVQAGAVVVDVTFAAALPAGARPDQSVSGVIEIARLPNVLYLGRPAAARPSTQLSLFRLDKDGRGAERVNVQLGHTSVTQIEIRSGLVEGDKAVLSDVSQWEKSARLRLD
jgi:HlyD family secretion protein